MKKKFISLLLIAAMALTLCACGHQHTWVEATCTEPKTCSECGETEGEALGHQFSEATYWEAPTCSVCGAVEGEPLTPALEAQGFTATDIEDVEEPSISMDSDNHLAVSGISIALPCEYKGEEVYMSIGHLRRIDHSVVESDETHPAKDGYEWHIAHLEGFQYGTFYMLDENGNRQRMFPDGIRLQCAGLDYYSGELIPDGSTFSVVWDGKEYPECRFACLTTENSDDSISVDTDNGTIYISDGVKTNFAVSYLVPVGYDGALIGIYSADLDLSQFDSPLDASGEDTAFVRFE